MEDQQTIPKERDLLALLELHFKDNSCVKHEDFEHVPKELAKEFGNATVSEWHKVVKFISDQLGLWGAEWLFSSVNSPNTVAEAEFRGWVIVSRACRNALVERVPGLRGEIEREHELTILRHTMERSINYNKTRWFQRFTALLVSWMSIQLNRIGFKKIGNELYAWSLYPPGTVGRSKKWAHDKDK